MASKYIFVSEILVNSDRAEIAWDIWRNSSIDSMPEGSIRQCYRGEEEPNRFLEMIAFESIADIEQLIGLKDSFSSSQLPPLMVSDWHQQIFEIVDAVKPCKELLPETNKLQLRYIEVPLSVHADYLQWREDTIFEVVRNAPAIECFLAYHTLLSTQPGVMFFSGFEGDTYKYMQEIFKTPKYNKIVQEAGSKYIAGGENGLYTRVYLRD